MREIKFRGKCKGCEWVYGSYCRYMEDDGTTITCILGDTHDDIESCVNFNEVDFESVGQYTGMKDRNGKEIYEGDIVNWISIGISGQGFTEEGVVEFRTEEMAIIVVNHIRTMDHRENVRNILRCRRALRVVGNIYDNPELMKL